MVNYTKSRFYQNQSYISNFHLSSVAYSNSVLGEHPKNQALSRNTLKPHSWEEIYKASQAILRVLGQWCAYRGASRSRKPRSTWLETLLNAASHFKFGQISRFSGGLFGRNRWVYEAGHSRVKLRVEAMTLSDGLGDDDSENWEPLATLDYVLLIVASLHQASGTRLYWIFRCVFNVLSQVFKAAKPVMLVKVCPHDLDDCFW